MKRREFLGVLGGAAAAMPLAARAQPQPMPVIGMLTSTSVSSERRAAFNLGLRETGFFDGQNVAIDYKAAQGQADRMQAMLAAMIRRPVALIVANSIAARAAKDATTTIPIVFTVGSDPVADGLVTSLNRPGGNVTGASFLAGRLGTKRLDLLRQVVPKATAIGLLINPDLPEKLGLQLHIAEIRVVADFELRPLQ